MMQDKQSVNIYDALASSPRLSTVIRVLGYEEAYRLYHGRKAPIEDMKPAEAYAFLRDSLQGPRLYRCTEHRQWREKFVDPDTNEVSWVTMHTCPNDGRDCHFRTVGGLTHKRLKYIDSVIEFAALMVTNLDERLQNIEETDMFHRVTEERRALRDMKVAEAEALARDAEEYYVWMRYSWSGYKPYTKCDEVTEAFERMLAAKAAVNHVRAEYDAGIRWAQEDLRVEFREVPEGKRDPWSGVGHRPASDEAVENGTILGILQEEVFYEEHHLYHSVLEQRDARAQDQSDVMRRSDEFIRWPVGKTLKVPVRKPGWLRFPEELQQDFVDAGFSIEAATVAAQKEWQSNCQLMRVIAHREADRLGLLEQVAKA